MKVFRVKKLSMSAEIREVLAAVADGGTGLGLRPAIPSTGRNKISELSWFLRKKDAKGFVEVLYSPEKREILVSPMEKKGTEWTEPMARLVAEYLADRLGGSL